MPPIEQWTETDFLRGNDLDTFLISRKPAEFYDPRRYGEERVILTLADEFSRMDHRAALTNNDASRADQLAAETFYPKHFWIAVTAVYAAAAAFFMRHSCSLLLA